MITAVRHFHRRVRSDERGVVAIWVALCATVFMGLVASAVDVGLAYHERTRLAAALDAAGLAMGAAPPGTTQTELKRIGQLYFNQNYGNDGLTGQPVAMQASFSQDLNTITVSAMTQVPTNFARTLGFESIPVAAQSEVRRLSKALELAMVLDNTGSMWGNNNIQALRDAASTMVNILFGSNTVHPNLKIGLVPYSVAVNVSPVANEVMTAFPKPLDASNRDTENWKGCVIERAAPHDTQDTGTTIGGKWTQYWWPTSTDNNWKATVRDKYGRITQAADVNNDNSKLDNGVHGPNIGCPTPIVPLTNVKQTLLDAIKAMTAWNRGGTMSSVGMSWGLRMLSPEPPLTQGVAWDNPDWKKAVVLMTDGDNLLYNLTGNAGVNQPDSATSSDWSAYGRIDTTFAQSIFHTKNLNTVRDMLNTKLASVCQDMKAKKITVYTIIFTSGITEATKQIYRDCASDPSKYFYAPNQSDLLTAFTTIGYELSNLRVSR